jgi:transcription initiation factor TFIIE subunit alpha
MQKRQKKIYEFQIVKDFLKDIGGEFAIELVKICINKKKPITDEEIGKKLPLKITEIRAILNRLHYRGVACYQKTRNNKTGWYSYTWEIKPDRISELILEKQAEQMQKLEKDIEFQGGHVFFSAGKGMAEYPFEIAAEYDFKCPETGKPLEAIDNKKRIKELEKKMENLKKEVEAIKELLK